jgi:hypothetical protein
VKSVPVTELELAYNDDDHFGELRVYFDTMVWITDKFGLIYTDPQWLKELRNLLRQLEFSVAAAKDVSYSEQGMQGDDYVSLDVGAKFIKAWKKNCLHTLR